MKKRRRKLKICSHNNMMKMYDTLGYAASVFVNLKNSYECIDKYLSLYKDIPERVKKLMECKNKLHYYGDQFKYNYRTLSNYGEFESLVTDMYWSILRLIRNWEKEDDVVKENRKAEINTNSSKLPMKWIYFERFKDKLKANKVAGYSTDECKFLLRVANALSWSFKYGKHKDRNAPIVLELESSKHIIDRKFTTKNRMPLQTIFREYETIDEVKSCIRTFFDAVKTLYSEVKIYCRNNGIDEEDFNILVYDERIWIHLDPKEGVFGVSLTDNKYGVATVANEKNIFLAFIDNFRLDTGLKNVLFKMVARDNGTYDVGYDIKYIYER